MASWRRRYILSNHRDLRCPRGILVCRLRKVLYGLKQAPRAWYSRIDTYLQDLGFEKSEVDPNLYYLVDGEDPIILVLYVDDLFITGAERLIGRCKVDLATEFEMKDIGLMH